MRLVFFAMSDIELYTELSNLLAARGDAELYDFEIIPDELAQFVDSPNNIAVFREEYPVAVIITKTTLVRAYLEARKIFFSEDAFLDDDDEQKEGTKAPDDRPVVTEKDLHDEKRLLATEVMLLFDPENLTACNFRKRMILKKRAQYLRRNTGFPGEKELILSKEPAYMDLLQRERAFSTMYLRAPLHRHAKSSTLWYHRIWLLRLFTQTYRWHLGMQALVHWGSHKASHEHSSPLCDLDTSLNYVSDFCHSETSVVLAAGARHPKNYYAFDALRVFFEDMHAVLHQEYPYLEAQTRVRIKSLIASDVSLRVFEWCAQHPSDTSGWSYLFHSLSQLVDDEQQRRNEILDRARNFAVRISWEGKSFLQFIALGTEKWQYSTCKPIIQTEGTHT